MTTKIHDLPTNKLHPSPLNPRKTFRKLDELAADVAAHGVLQPITVRPNADGHEIVFGERRWRAAKLAKLATLPCIVKDLDDVTALELMIVENSQRDDVHPVEEAEGYAQLQKTMSVDDIAAKVNKSRSHIYGRLKLCALTDKSKKAALGDEVSASLALLLARIPDKKLQDEALEAVTSKDWQGALPSYREARRILEQNFACHLKEAGFDLKDATLVPKAGACTTCPHRTGNQRELFGEVDKASADVCTNPPCFKGKRDADWQRKADAAKAKGLRVLSDKEAKAALGKAQDRSSEFVDLAHENYDDPKYRKWGALLGKSIDVVLARDERGQVHELVPRGEAQKAVKAKHPQLAKEPARGGYDYRAADRAREQKAKRARAARDLALERLTVAAEKAPTDAFWRVVCDIIVAQSSQDAVADTVKRRALGDARNSGKAHKTLATAAGKMSVAARRGLVVELLGHCHVSAYNTGFGRSLPALCKLYGVDLKKCEREAAKAVKAKKKGKAKK